MSPSTATIRPTADTYLNIDDPPANHSTEDTLNVYTWPDDKIANAIAMKFDFSSIPAGSTISSATLNLYLQATDATSDPTYTVTVHKIVNKNPDLARATGSTYDGINSWTPNNCCYNSIPMAQADISAPADSRTIDKTLGFKQWDVTSIVQGWFSNPASNFGLLLNSDPSKLADRYRQFSSSENPATSQRPYLTVIYTAPGAPICEATGAGRCYYVANNPGSGAGTFTNPYGLADLPKNTTSYCTLDSPALQALQPGDILYFRGGDYLFDTCASDPSSDYEIGYIRPARSGTAGSPITIEGYPGETAHLVVRSGLQPVLGNRGNELGTSHYSYVRFVGLAVEPQNGNAASVYFKGPDQTSLTPGLELAYCEVIGTYVPTGDNHDGVRLENLTAPWVHGNVIHGVQGNSHNSAGIKLYTVQNAVIEVNYIHDNWTGIYDKQSAVDNIYRRNFLTANTEQFLGTESQGNTARYQVHDNVVDGQIEIQQHTDGTSIYDNLFRYNTLAGASAGNTWNSQLWNNIVIAGGAPITAYYSYKDSLSTTPPHDQLAYMDYNVYDASPSYVFARDLASEQDLTLTGMQAVGYELHTAVAPASDIFVDQVSYQLKPQWQTAGRYGDAVGPDSTSAIINTSRYGPMGRP